MSDHSSKSRTASSWAYSHFSRYSASSSLRRPRFAAGIKDSLSIIVWCCLSYHPSSSLNASVDLDASLGSFIAELLLSLASVPAWCGGLSGPRGRLCGALPAPGGTHTTPGGSLRVCGRCTCERSLHSRPRARRDPPYGPVM